MSAAAIEQGASASSLKAAFLYNFAKFVEWPSDALPAGAPLSLCVIGDPAVADALDSAVRGRTADGHPLLVRRLSPADEARTCHVLYLSGMDATAVIELLTHTDAAPVFTVGDVDRFAQLGGIAHLFVENGKMRFAMNVESAQRARLRISSRLLGLAVLVKDGRNGSPH